MSQMLKSSGAMAVATLTSRLLGMVREMVYATFMGVGPVASAFVLAFQVPNLFRRLLGEGALTAAFISDLQAQGADAHGEAEMWRAANAGHLRTGDRRGRRDGAGHRGHFFWTEVRDRSGDES